MGIVYPPSPLKGLEILSCSNDHQFSKHLHDGYVLWLNSESGEHFSVNGTSDILHLGRISIIEPGVVHSNRACIPNHRHLRSFYFSEVFLQKLYTHLTEKLIDYSLPTCTISNHHLWREFCGLHDLLLHSEDSLSKEVETVTTFSKLYDEDLRRGVRSGFSTEKNRIQRVVDYFHGNINRKIHLDELADLVHCTSYYLIRLFQEQRGIAPHKFLIQIRLERARVLLDEGHDIVDAALLSGFADQSHLTRLFKARYGLTPGVYRKQKNLR